jgi:hypothetical protein
VTSSPFEETAARLGLALESLPRRAQLGAPVVVGPAPGDDNGATSCGHLAHGAPVRTWVNAEVTVKAGPGRATTARSREVRLIRAKTKRSPSP